MTSRKHWLFALALVFLAGGEAAAQSLSGAALVQALRQGGYVLVMRHASSPTVLPDRAAAAPGNFNLERQLDENGQKSAQAMGAALKTLSIPLGDVLSSPTYRALETVRFGAFGEAKSFAELGDGGRSMAPVTDIARNAFLRGQAAKAPRAGTDTLVVTHAPNIAAAFGRDGQELSDGEALVFQPDGKGGTEIVARIRIEDWPRLASSR
jgi:phosphohistidine phosphatase SixA